MADGYTLEIANPVEKKSHSASTLPLAQPKTTRIRVLFAATSLSRPGYSCSFGLSSSDPKSFGLSPCPKSPDLTRSGYRISSDLREMAHIAASACRLFARVSKAISPHPRHAYPSRAAKRSIGASLNKRCSMLLPYSRRAGSSRFSVLPRKPGLPKTDRGTQQSEPIHFFA